MAGKRSIRPGLTLLLVIALLIPQLLISPRQVDASSDKIDPALQAKMAADPDKKLPIIVEMVPSMAPFAAGANEQRAQAALDLLVKLKKDGRPIGALPLINGAAGFANAKGINALSRSSSVAFIHEDSTIQPRGDNDDPNVTRPPGLLSAPYPRVVRADKVWLEGPTGKNITVAVLDSGIAPHDDLTLPTNRLVAAVNFAGDRGGVPDRGGHGTHIAGVIAGNGTRSDLSKRQAQPVWSGDADQVEYVGIAPGANVVDVRVLNQQGFGRVSSVVRGIEWVLAHRAQYNIRIINLSFGAPARRSYRLDPLTAAIEIAWKRGVVVVVAAGNGGPNEGSVETPGIDPFAITAGATDDHGTLPVTDDELAWFSAWGTPPDESRSKPDIIAPGRRIVSLRVPGSYLDTLFPDRVVVAKSGADYFRLTGTSMSTAIVSGVVALMLEHRPALSPDQVKAILIGTTQVYGQDSQSPPTNPAAGGAGLVDAYAAVNSPPLGVANQGLRPADGLARALYPILYGQPLSWNDPNLAGIAWDNLAWDNLAWDNLAWDNLAWDNLAWDNLAWDNLAWDNLAWDNLAWDNLAWDSFGTLD
ncbi:MAG: S8 family peptidase [Ardenticatenaceae bacterium]|nr:S8 family peptidase [Ardenticatenaceae bacterium]